jgi:hypothetical protein
VIPEGSAASRAALDKVASKKLSEFDRRIGASAADYGKQFATGDKRQAEALIKSGLMTREQIVSLTPPGLRPGEGWSSSTIAALVAIALAGSAQEDSK